jgi:hypothetical protein
MADGLLFGDAALARVVEWQVDGLTVLVDTGAGDCPQCPALGDTVAEKLGKQAC